MHLRFLMLRIFALTFLITATGWVIMVYLPAAWMYLTNWFLHADRILFFLQTNFATSPQLIPTICRRKRHRYAGWVKSAIVQTIMRK